MSDHPSVLLDPTSFKTLQKEMAGVSEAAITQEPSPLIPTPVEPFKPITEEEITKQLAQQQDPIGVAALNFGLYYPKFCSMVDELSAKPLKRLLKAVVGHPLEGNLPNMKRDEERMAFSIAQSLSESKMVLVLDSLYKRNQELANATAAPTAQEIIDNAMQDSVQISNNNGENNG